MKSLVLGPSLFNSESLRSIQRFKDLLSLKLNGAVSCWDSQLLESIGTLPKLLELVVDTGDAEYHAVHSPLPVLGSFNSPPIQPYPGLSDFPDHPPPETFSDFGSGSQPFPIPVSPSAHRKDVEFNSDCFVKISRGDSRLETPYTTRTPSPVLHAFQRIPECNVSDLAVASPSATPLQSTTAAIPNSPSHCSSAFPKLPSLEIAGYKALRSLSVTGSLSLIHQILTSIASLDLDAVTLVIRLSQAKLSVPEPSRPPPSGPTSHELRGTFPSGGSNKGNKDENKLYSPKPSTPPTPRPISDDSWGNFAPGGPHKKIKGKSKPSAPRPSTPPKPSTPFTPGPISEPRPFPDKEPHWTDAVVRSDPPSIKDTAPITDGQLLALTSRIASQWANCIRVVDMKPFRSTTFFFSAPTNAILSFARCKVLEVLDFRGWNFGPLLNNTISDLAHCWPRLTSLYLSGGNLTIPTLRVLALSCPLLNTLETNISLDDIPPINPTRGDALSHPLKVLSAGDNGTTIQNARVLLLVARHLNILFPHVKVTTHESYNAEQWLQIGEFVEVLQAVQKDDADRGS